MPRGARQVEVGVETGDGMRRWRLGLLALAVVLVLGSAGQALVPAAERQRGERTRAAEAAALELVEEATRQARRGQVETEIVGGNPVLPGNFTFMTKIIVEGPSGGIFHCGGSLIDALYVLTAAHCVAGSPQAVYSPDKFALIIGKGNWTEWEQENVFGVDAVMVHPGWNTTSKVNDVAVLRLTSAVPASMATPVAFVDVGETELDAEGELVTVAGWGHTSSGGEGTAELRAANLYVVGDDECDAAYGSGRIDYERMLCAAFAGRDTCQGDSGGPIFNREFAGYHVVKKKKKKGKGKKAIRIPVYREVQLGITSFGIGCANPDYPGVYAQLSAPGINDFIVEAME